MPRAQKQGRKPKQLPMESFIFEIKRWEPSYSLRIDYDRYADSPYSEHVGIRIEASCINPPKLAGREARIDFVAERDRLKRKRRFQATALSAACRPQGR